ncbi:hypothetical protein HGG74_13990 [Arthrobacter sp. E918]|uniref:Uncharacterized protein n=1 Tax=Arthrobacter mobilis TaxID=2724944 RepID=A0A7X6HGJ8_9MICC|nr:hypothetical protein [Arthrobacter mobilis]
MKRLITFRTAAAAAILSAVLASGTLVTAAPASAGECPEQSICTDGKPTSSTTVGSVLRANKYGWPKGTKLEYRWYRDGCRIAGGWDDTYTVRTYDAGAKITVRVTGIKGSQKTYKDGRAYNVEHGNRTIGKSTSYTTVGSVLRANKYGWDKGTKLEYHWYRVGSCGLPDGWETYEVRPEDKGTKIVVRVHGTKAGKPAYTISRTYIVR